MLVRFPGLARAYRGLAYPFARAQDALWGASLLTSDATYTFGLRSACWFVVPVLAIRRAGYTWDDLLLGWRATPGSIFRLVALFAAAFFLNAAKLAPVDTLPSVASYLKIPIGGH